MKVAIIHAGADSIDEFVEVALTLPGTSCTLPGTTC